MQNTEYTVYWHYINTQYIYVNIKETEQAQLILYQMRYCLHKTAVIQEICFQPWTKYAMLCFMRPWTKPVTLCFHTLIKSGTLSYTKETDSCCTFRY